MNKWFYTQLVFAVVTQAFVLIHFIFGGILIGTLAKIFNTPARHDPHILAAIGVILFMSVGYVPAYNWLNLIDEASKTQ
jgi:ABC-type Na+ efflux pump permease subunit